MPWTVRNYKLDELTTVTALRSNLALMFREYANIKDPRVVDVLIYKGREELEVIPDTVFSVVEDYIHSLH